jgi:hypothetical protein
MVPSSKAAKIDIRGLFNEYAEPAYMIAMTKGISLGVDNDGDKKVITYA